MLDFFSGGGVGCNHELFGQICARSIFDHQNFLENKTKEQKSQFF